MKFGCCYEKCPSECCSLNEAKFKYFKTVTMLLCKSSDFNVQNEFENIVKK